MQFLPETILWCLKKQFRAINCHKMCTACLNTPSVHHPLFDSLENLLPSNRLHSRSNSLVLSGLRKCIVSSLILHPKMQLALSLLGRLIIMVDDHVCIFNLISSPIFVFSKRFFYRLPNLSRVFKKELPKEFTGLF